MAPSDRPDTPSASPGPSVTLEVVLRVGPWRLVALEGDGAGLVLVVGDHTLGKELQARGARPGRDLADAVRAVQAEDATFQPRVRGEGGWWLTSGEAAYLLGALGGVATARAARELAAAFDLAGERLRAFVASLNPRETPRAPVRLPTPSERAELERAAIVAALEQHKGNKVQAARTLGIARGTFYRRLREFGLE